MTNLERLAKEQGFSNDLFDFANEIAANPDDYDYRAKTWSDNYLKVWATG